MFHAMPTIKVGEVSDQCFIRAIRSWPHPGFLGHLRSYEKVIYGSVKTNKQLLETLEAFEVGEDVLAHRLSIIPTKRGKEKTLSMRKRDGRPFTGVSTNI
jgi:hypothetical protein